MTQTQKSWRNAKLPPNTALFTIGDVHGCHDLLAPLLAGIEKQIAALPEGTTAHVVFIGDYLDRGTNGPETIKLLQDFKTRVANNPKINAVFLAGNHEIGLHNLLTASEIDTAEIGNKDDKNDFRHVLHHDGGKLCLRGLTDMLFSGGMLTTIRNYAELHGDKIDETLFIKGAGGKMKPNPDHPNFLAGVNKLVKDFQRHMPEDHQQFIKETLPNHYFMLGDYLCTHAGVDPSRDLASQGITPVEGVGKQSIPDAQYMQSLMIRNPFLWPDTVSSAAGQPIAADGNHLPYCPYIVLHGHTPSEITFNNMTVVDGQKDYRLCVDTNVYQPNGSLSCFARHGDQAHFMSVGKQSPVKKPFHYIIDENNQAQQAWVHSFLNKGDNRKYHDPRNLHPYATAANDLNFEVNDKSSHVNMLATQAATAQNPGQLILRP